jgi:hypothetical protein
MDIALYITIAAKAVLNIISQIPAHMIHFASQSSDVLDLTPSHDLPQ